MTEGKERNHESVEEGESLGGVESFDEDSVGEGLVPASAPLWTANFLKADLSY